MAIFSTPESRVQFRALPQDIEQPHIQLQASDEHVLDLELLVMVLRFALVAIFMLALPLRHSHSHPLTSHPITPKFLLNSLRVSHFNISDGELSATWDVTLVISNVMNSTNVNIQRLHSNLSYHDNQTLAAAVTPIAPQESMEAEQQEKSLHFKFRTTEWDKDQSIVEETVIQAMALDKKRGVIRFGVNMRVQGEISSRGRGWVLPFIMYPCCPNLDVQFSSNQQGDVATLIPRPSRECSGFIQWGRVQD